MRIPTQSFVFEMKSLNRSTWKSADYLFKVKHADVVECNPSISKQIVVHKAQSSERIILACRSEKWNGNNVAHFIRTGEKNKVR